MKMEIWPDVSIPEMTDWLAELRDDGPAEPPEGSYAPPSPDSHPYPEVPAPAPVEGPVPAGQADEPEESMPPSWARALARASASSKTSPPGWAWTRAVASTPAEADALGEAGPPAEADPPAEITTRALIGDQLRMPVMWCEMGSCISRYSDPAASGEADIRARAIGAGWRVDAFGRLACPQCQQTAAGFRVSRPVVLWDRRTAITKAARMAAARGNGAPGGHARDPRRSASAPQPGRHRGRPAAETLPYGPRTR